MIGGTLVELTVGQVLPSLEETQVGVLSALTFLIYLVTRNHGTSHGTVQKERRGIQEVAKG